MSIGSNICIACITFAYVSSCKIFAKQEFSICTIIGLHLHLHIHAGANPYITSTYICILMKDICITSTCIPKKNLHLRYHIAAFMSAYPIRIFCIRHSMNKHLHMHLHLHPHEGHLHNKILIRIIIRLRSYLHIQ